MRSTPLTKRSRNIRATVPAISSSRWIPSPVTNSGIFSARGKAASTHFESLVDDAILIDRITAGDEESARGLVERLRPTILKCTRRCLPRWASEEDLVQTVFVKIFSKLHQFSGSVPLEHWVSRIAVNTSLNQINYEASRPELRMSDLGEEQEAVLQNVSTSPNGSEDRDYAREALQLLLAQLRPDERRIIILLHIEQRSTHEISQLTGLSISSVKVKAFRTRHKMQRLGKRFLREDSQSAAWLGKR